MILLGIESSCDETGVAVVRDGKVLVDLVSSQVDVHTEYGGVVPEFASRMQLEAIGPLTDRACRDAGIRLSQIDGIAVTSGPGLIGSVLVGMNFAKGLAYSLDKPLIAVDHVRAHLFSPLIEHGGLAFPYIGLVVSGGHTELYTVKSMTDVLLEGKTIDDAAGEAYDKVAGALGLGYPGGPVMDRLAAQGAERRGVKFPMAMMRRGNYDFSFSGLKTAVMRYIKEHSSGLTHGTVSSIAVGFQDAVTGVLVKKTIALARQRRIRRIAVSGGVAANTGLRKMLAAYRDEFEMYIPSSRLCTDNGSMIGFLGYRLFELGIQSDMDTDAYANNTHVPQRARAAAS
ncbi:MAG: tRNA (adenosine(37)-N6)-threonylcarbamoyltransferase complex transferase subunit TsaD [Deltaproteobacteria bacterium]|nr:tRNA (adenosine(37)-N6)-threonylcarbamoyltransferase complex transferase subunit TsaD [Deltaproteobacteria bacterium]MCL5277682.1 tRNA (adenosine(37)-N6)-threonylcarbamoyltransferase complex transferase subunit TsaD [Deltaproteobacteria bacterium]